MSRRTAAARRGAALLAVLSSGICGSSMMVGAEPLPGAGGQDQPPPSANDPFAPRWTTQRLAWRGEIEEGTRLELVNEFGDLRIRAGSGWSVEVSAVAQRREDLDLRPEIATSAEDGRLIVAVRYPSETIPPVLVEPGAPLDRRVDLVVFVPPEAAIHARTVLGRLEAKGLGAPAELTTRTGDITVRTRAPLRARSEHGSIGVLLQKGWNERRWNDPLLLETVTGDIRLELPKNARAEVTISTRGEITTDYSIAIERHGRLRKAVASLGAGGSAIRIETTKGRVVLLEALAVD